MQSFLSALFLGIVVIFFFRPVKVALRHWFHASAFRIFLIPTLLAGLFATILLARGAWSTPFLLLATVYVSTPTLLVFLQRSTQTAAGISPNAKVRNSGNREARCWLDLMAVLALWLPLEFNIGKELIPHQAWGLMNLGARGASVTLALFLFLIFRETKGMKYELPRRLSDFTNPLVGFVIAARCSRYSRCGWGSWDRFIFLSRSALAPSAFFG